MKRGRTALSATFATAAASMRDGARGQAQSEHANRLRKTLETARERLSKAQSRPLTPFRVALVADSRRLGFGAEELLKQAQKLEHLLALCLDETPGAPPWQTQTSISLVTDEHGLPNQPDLEQSRNLSSTATRCVRETLSLAAVPPLGQPFRRARLTLTIEPFETHSKAGGELPSAQDTWETLRELEQDLNELDEGAKTRRTSFEQTQAVFEAVAAMKLDEGPDLSRLIAWLTLQGKDTDARRILREARWNKGLRLALFSFAGAVVFWFVLFRLWRVRKRLGLTRREEEP